ncbi:MAG: hypothetical protein ACI9XC_000471 [Gammaproteobacteria bacterium]|jgi:hypothetical protein
MIKFCQNNVAILFIISITFSVQSRADDLLNTAPNPIKHNVISTPDTFNIVTIETARHGRETFTQKHPQTSPRNNLQVIYNLNTEVTNRSNRRKNRSTNNYPLQKSNIYTFYSSSNQHSDNSKYKQNNKRNNQGYNGSFIHYNSTPSLQYFYQNPATNYRYNSIQDNGYNQQGQRHTLQQKPNKRVIRHCLGPNC